MAIDLRDDDASSSRSTSPAPELAGDVQALLASFLSERDEREKQLEVFTAEQAADPGQGRDASNPPISIERWLALYQEDWQLSRAQRTITIRTPV
jgi:hypothetical protein